MINEKMQKALNNQVNAEVYAAYLYLSMSAYFEMINLPGRQLDALPVTGRSWACDENIYSY